MDEIIINKKTTIDRCIKRIQQDFQADFKQDYTKQDAVILNIERACQAAIDIANRYLKNNNLGIPQSNRDSFLKLEINGIITPELSQKLQSMAGFRNLAVHDYSSLNLDVVIDIVENHLADLQNFALIILKKM